MATVPSACGTMCNPPTNNCGASRASNRNAADWPFTPSPTLRPSASDRSTRPRQPVAQITAPASSASGTTDTPLTRSAATSAAQARRGCILALSVSRISQPEGDTGAKGPASDCGTTSQTALPCHNAAAPSPRARASASPASSATGCSRPVRA